MEKEFPKCHLFICTNKKEAGKECCADKGALELYENVRADVRAQGRWGEIRVTKTGCLGYCKQGITAVVYPAGEWQLHLDKTDSDRLKSSLDRLVSAK